MSKNLKTICVVIACIFSPGFIFIYGIYRYCKYVYNRIKAGDPKYWSKISSSSSYTNSSSTTNSSSDSFEFRDYTIDESGRIHDNINGGYPLKKEGNSIYNGGRKIADIDEFGRIYDYNQNRYVADIDESGNVKDRGTGYSIGRYDNGRFRSYNRF